MVVGFTTSYAISAFHHYSCEFDSRLLGRHTQYNIIRQSLSVTCGRSEVFNNKTIRQVLTEILLKEAFNTITLTLSFRMVY